MMFFCLFFFNEYINRLIHKNEIKAVIKGSKCSERSK